MSMVSYEPDRDWGDENAYENRLRLFGPEPDPEPCKCKPQWLVTARSPSPDLYEQWTCSHCGSRVIRGLPHRSEA